MTRALSVLSLLAALAVPTAAHATVPVTLKGSPSSMIRQHRVAQHADFSFVRDEAQLRRLVDGGYLVRLEGNADYAVKSTVSYPYARPELRLFIERLARQYREGTGERLVVTSLTRPKSAQPRNAHHLSVHPTGMAVDLRVSSRRASRAWLESVLLKLEGRGLLDVTRERRPPHYHIAVFPDAYRTYVEGMIGPEAVAARLAGEAPEEERAAAEPAPRAVPETAEVAATVSLSAERETSGRDRAGGVFMLVALGALLAAVPLLRRRAPGRSVEDRG